LAPDANNAATASNTTEPVKAASAVRRLLLLISTGPLLRDPQMRQVGADRVERRDDLARGRQREVLAGIGRAVLQIVEFPDITSTV